MHTYELVDLDGKLALYHMTLTATDRPALVSHYYTSTIPATQYTQLLGRVPWFPSGSPFQGSGAVRTDWGGEMRIICNDWTPVQVDTPIAKPHDGREYSWRWASWGKWEKSYYDKCADCGRYHNPTLPYCDKCGWCHKGKCKHS